MLALCSHGLCSLLQMCGNSCPRGRPPALRRAPFGALLCRFLGRFVFPLPLALPLPLFVPLFPACAGTPPRPLSGRRLKGTFRLRRGGGKGGFKRRLSGPLSRLPPRSGLPALCPRSSFCGRFPPPACALFAAA
jgi:hypothetical protein